MRNLNSKEHELGDGAKAFCLLFGVVLPCVCFGLSMQRPFEGPTWQSGRWSDVVALMLGGWPSWAFYPILIFSMTCLFLFIWSEEWGRTRWLRIGIYGGVFIAFQFGVLLGAALTSDNRLQATVIYYLFGTAVTACMTAIMARFKAKWRGENSILWVGFVMTLVVGGFLLFPLVLSFAPWITAAAFAVPSITLARRFFERRFSIKSMLLVTTWVCAFVASWREAWVRALVLYSELPLQPNDCFVVGAAAKGHSGFVGSWRLGNAAWPINRQLLRLKGLELLLKASMPKLHLRLRRLYDAVGPVVARRISNPWIADGVYLLLKPAEFFAGLVLRMLRLSTNQVERLQ
jgi:hypothetical protein